MAVYTGVRKEWGTVRVGCRLLLLGRRAYLACACSQAAREEAPCEECCSTDPSPQQPQPLHPPACRPAAQVPPQPGLPLRTCSHLNVTSMLDCRLQEME